MEKHKVNRTRGRNSIYTDFNLWYTESNITNKDYLLIEDREHIKKCLESKGLHFDDISKYNSFPLPFVFKVKGVEIDKDKRIGIVYYRVFKVISNSYFFGDFPWEYEMKYRGRLSVRTKRQLINHLERGGKPPSFQITQEELHQVLPKSALKRNP